MVPSEAAPWAGKRHSYAGWIPNVHSHLSFSLIGVGRGPDVATLTRRLETKLCRFVCTLQHRQTDDFLAPGWWTRLFRPQAIQDFLIIGSTVEVQTPIGVIDVAIEVTPKPAPPSRRLPATYVFRRPGANAGDTANLAKKQRGVETALDDQGMLRGRIFVMPWQRNKVRRERQTLWLAGLRHKLRGTSRIEDVELENFLQDLTHQVAENSHLSVSLDFALFRTGEVRIWFEDEVAARLDDAQRREISRQAYYFMKDMVHHHVHHDAKSDQITPLTEIGNADPKMSEELWRRDTVWSLSRAVDALARRGKLKDLREATGILAYADAFQKTLLLYRRRQDDPAAFEPNAVTYRYDFAHIRESLKVQLDHVISRRTTLSQVLVAGLAGCIAATALLVSAISAFNGAVNGKIKGAPVELGVTHDILQQGANFFPVPAIAVGFFLWLVSSQILSEDRIGAEPGRRRKFAQGIRGVANSIAVRRGWDGADVQRWLVRFYLVVLAGLMATTYYGAPRAIALARYLSGLELRAGQKQPPGEDRASPQKNQNTPQPERKVALPPTISPRSPADRPKTDAVPPAPDVTNGSAETLGNRR